MMRNSIVLSRSMARSLPRAYGTSSLSSLGSLHSLSSLSEMDDMLDYGSEFIRSSLSEIESTGEQIGRRVQTLVDRAKKVAQQVNREEASTSTLTPLIQLEISASQATAWSSELLTIPHYDTVDMGRFERHAARAFDRAQMFELSDACTYMRENPLAAPALWIKGVHFGAIPPTSPERCDLPTHLPEGVLAGLARQLGTKIVGFKDECIYSHPLFHDIRPVKGGNEGSVGDGKPLDHHMDMSYKRNQAPNYVALACLREGTDHTVTTPFVDNAELHRRIRESYPEDIKVLSDPKSFSVRKPLSTGGGLAEPGALLTYGVGGPVFWLRVDHNLMIPETPEAASALTHMRDILYKVECNDVHLCSGDVLLVNNYKALHRRSHFTPTFTGTDRLLMRSYFKAGKISSSRMLE